MTRPHSWLQPVAFPAYLSLILQCLPLRTSATYILLFASSSFGSPQDSLSSPLSLAMPLCLLFTRVASHLHPSTAFSTSVRSALPMVMVPVQATLKTSFMVKRCHGHVALRHLLYKRRLAAGIILPCPAPRSFTKPHHCFLLQPVRLVTASTLPSHILPRLACTT